MKKKKPTAEVQIRQFAPGLVVVSHEEMDSLEDFFAQMPERDIKALVASGYTVIGLHSSYNILSFTDAELAEYGLARIKPTEIPSKMH